MPASPQLPYGRAPGGPPLARDLYAPAGRRRRWSGFALVAVAVIAIVGAVAAGVFLLLPKDRDYGPNRIARPFPTQPSVGWTLRAGDIGPGVLLGSRGIDQPRILNLGTIALVSSIDQDGDSAIVAVGVADGRVLWRTPPGAAVENCASQPVRGILPCAMWRGASNPDMVLVNLSDGQFRTVAVRKGLAGVDVADGRVFTGGIDDDAGVMWLARGSLDDPFGDWLEEYPYTPGTCPGAGGSVFSARHGVVALAAGVHAVAARAKDGRRLSPGVVNSVVVIPGQGVAVTECVGELGNTHATEHRTTVVDLSANFLADIVGRMPWTVVPGELRTPPVVAGSRAHNLGDGSVAWSVEDDVDFRHIVGDTLLAKRSGDYDGPVSAYALADGRRLWEADLPRRFEPQASDGGRVVGLAHDYPDGHVYAVDLSTGEVAWQLADVGVSVLGPVGDGLALLSEEALTYYPPPR